MDRDQLAKKSKAELIELVLDLQKPTKHSDQQANLDLERLQEALDALGTPLALFDSDDKYLFVNKAYREINAAVGSAVRRGVKYETHIRRLLEKGLIPAAKGKEEQWIANRLQHHRNPDAPTEQIRSDGTHLRFTETILSDGGTLLVVENITSQKLADQALVESEQARAYLSSAIEEIAEGIALFDQDDRLMLANKSWWDMNKEIRGITVPGTSFEEHIWNCINAGLISESRGREKEWVAERLERHRKPTGQFEIVRDDGRVNLVNEQVLSNGGRILVILNVTEQKRLQSRLEEAVESISDAFILFDKEGKLVLCNSRFKEFFSSLADILTPGTSFETLFRAAVKNGVHPGKTPDDESYIQSRVKKFFEGQGTHERQLSDGRWILVSDRITRSGEIVGIRTDITELKEREEQASQARQSLLDAIESITDGFILFDEDGKMLMCNSKFKEYFHFLRDKLLPGVTYEELVDETLARDGVVLDGMSEEAWKKARLSEVGNAEGIHKMQMADGRWIQMSERRMKSGGIVGIRTDITDIVNAETESRKAMIAAETANKAKSEFLGNMSHELRTPLNAIIGFSSVISKELYGPIQNASYLEYAGDIQRSGEHLLTLISDLLDISRIEAGALTLEKIDLDVGNAVRECIRMIDPQCKSKGISIRTSLYSEMPRIYADPKHFRQILINVLSNAFKFTPANGTIKIATRLNKSNMAVIRITDTGIGIAKRDLPRILEPFGQVANANTRNHDGVGLGLPIVKSLVELHDGKLSVSSETGKGTTIQISMPVFEWEEQGA